MAKHRDDSQVTLILNHLKSGKEINPKEALVKFGCFRLSAVIFKLKNEGYLIGSRLESFTKPSGKKGHYSVYKLEED